MSLRKNIASDTDELELLHSGIVDICDYVMLTESEQKALKFAHHAFSDNVRRVIAPLGEQILESPPEVIEN